MSTRIIAGIFAVVSLAGSAACAVFGIVVFSAGGTVFQELAGICLMIVGSTLLVATAVFAAAEQRERICQTLEEILDRSYDVVDRLDRLSTPNQSPPSGPAH